MNATFTIAKREFRSYFDSPLAYVVICLSLLMLGVGVFVWPGKFWQVDRATLASMFEVIPIGLVVLIVPVVTMRLIAEEKRSSTLEMLITLPVRDSEVILGKFLGALLISSLTETQVIAFFITFIVLGMLYIVGELGALVPNALGTVLRELSFKEHYTSFQRGLIDTRDIVFFLSCAVLALLLAFRSLESRKWT